MLNRCLWLLYCLIKSCCVFGYSLGKNWTKGQNVSSDLATKMSGFLSNCSLAGTKGFFCEIFIFWLGLVSLLCKQLDCGCFNAALTWASPRNQSPRWGELRITNRWDQMKHRAPGGQGSLWERESSGEVIAHAHPQTWTQTQTPGQK